MKKSLLIAAAVAAGAFAVPAQAACTMNGTVEECFFLPDIVEPGSPFDVTFNPDGTISAALGRAGIGSMTDIGPGTGSVASPLEFLDTYFFIVDADGTGSGSVTTSASGQTAALAFSSTTNLDFLEVLVNGNPLAITRNPMVGPTLGLAESAGALFVPIFQGPQGNTIQVRGLARGNGSYGGEATFTPNEVPAVPEPGTWAMMLVGFGAVGFAMRRRRKDVARVRFAF